MDINNMNIYQDKLTENEKDTAQEIPKGNIVGYFKDNDEEECSPCKGSDEDDPRLRSDSDHRQKPAYRLCHGQQPDRFRQRSGNVSGNDF